MVVNADIFFILFLLLAARNWRPIISLTFKRPHRIFSKPEKSSGYVVVYVKELVGQGIYLTSLSGHSDVQIGGNLKII